MSKCHIVGNHMSWLKCLLYVFSGECASTNLIEAKDLIKFVIQMRSLDEPSDRMIFNKVTVI